MSRFRGIIYDNEKRHFEIVGATTDDLFTSNVIAMMDAGMDVLCQSAADDTVPASIKLPGYSLEENLYTRLLQEYETKTGKQLKRW